MILKNTQITFSPNITRLGYKTIDFSIAMDEIKTGKYKDKIEHLRTLDKNEYDLEKKRLPAYVFSGTFEGSKAVNDNRLKASNLMICDLDHLSDIESIRQKLIKLPFTACVFASPGGDGLKFCVHINVKDISIYNHYHDSLKNYLKQYDIVLDKGNDYARLCFVSYDPNLYVNYDAEMLNLDIEKNVSYHNKESESQTLEDLKNTMINWLTSTNRWKAITKYSYMKVKDGANKAQAILDTQGFMCLTPENQRDEHWQRYYDDISREVEGAISQFAADRIDDAVDWNEVKLEDVIRDSFKFNGINIPLPNGRFGELVEICRQMALYRYDCLAFITAVGLLAGMGGRRFNVSRSGLNVYMTLLMPTGYGKDSIEEIIKSILIQLQTVGNTSYDFVGEKNHTGPKSLVQSLHKRRCQVSVFTEKGLMEAIQSGDKAGLLRTLLGIYTRSGKGKEVSGEGYSDVKNNLPQLKNPALTIIAESVPDSFLEAVKNKGAMTSGDIARQSLYMYDGDRPYEAENVLVKFPEGELKAKLAQIARLGIAVQYEDNVDNKIIEVVLPDGYKSFSNEANDLFNKNKDSAKGVAATRMAHKAYKYAALAAIINNDYEDEDNYIYVKDEDWDWARNIVMYEMEQSLRCLGNSADGSVFDNLALNVLYHVMIGLQGKLGRHEVDSGIPCSMIRQKLIRNKKLMYDNTIKDPTAGLDDVLEYCIGIGYLSLNKAETNSCTKHYRKQARFMPSDRFIFTNTYLNAVKFNNASKSNT